jgi:hypothetical protein
MHKQVLLVALALAGSAVRRNVVSLFFLSLPVLAAMFLSVKVSEWIFVGPVGSFLNTELSFPENLARLSVLCFVIPPLAFAIGSSVVRLAPELGIRTAIALALAFSVLRIGVHLAAIDSLPMLVVSVIKIAVESCLMILPFLCGCISSHRRALVRNAAHRDPQQL